MKKEDYNKLPLLESFEDLKRGDTVYSKKYGLGEVASLYKDNEIIVSYAGLRKRFSIEEEDISKIPEGHIEKKKNKEKR